MLEVTVDRTVTIRMDEEQTRLMITAFDYAHTLAEAKRNEEYFRGDDARRRRQVQNFCLAMEDKLRG